MYLGLMLIEHLDYSVMANNVSMSANRALVLVISKYKAFGGLPFGSFTKLYDSIVMGTINYGAAIYRYGATEPSHVYQQFNTER